MKLIIFNILLLLNLQNDKILIDFINTDNYELCDDIISVTIIGDIETNKDYYNSKTYFTVEGYILIPYDSKGTNLVIGTCAETLYYYIIPETHHVSFTIKPCHAD